MKRSMLEIVQEAEKSWLDPMGPDPTWVILREMASRIDQLETIALAEPDGSPVDLSENLKRGWTCYAEQAKNIAAELEVDQHVADLAVAQRDQVHYAVMQGGKIIGCCYGEEGKAKWGDLHSFRASPPEDCPRCRKPEDTDG